MHQSKKIKIFVYKFIFETDFNLISILGKIETLETFHQSCLISKIIYMILNHQHYNYMMNQYKLGKKIGEGNSVY